jgi:hypothetical protein
VEYANRWAYFRNPEFFDFSELGGDCTNFASQCLYAGSGIMNYTPVTGWYYISPDDRAPAWTGVEYLYQFLTQNAGVGPYATDGPISYIEPGDLIQFRNDKDVFQHTPVVVKVLGPVATMENIVVAAHSFDSDCRPLLSYNFTEIRFLHVEGVRYEELSEPRPAPSGL